MNEPGTPVIEVDKLNVWFGKRHILHDVDFHVNSGEIRVIMGGSGSGKSTLLRHLLGLLRPQSGTVRILGTDVRNAGPEEMLKLRRQMGVSFQGGALFTSMTIGENVALPLREHTRLSDAEVRRKVTERLDWVGLQGVEEMKPSSLSGGMRKRVGLARALAMDPAYILYDEPTTGLDPIMSDVINRLIRSLQARIGVTSIVVTHDLNSAYHVGDVMAMLHEGHVVFTGTPGELRAAADPFVRQFVQGSSEGPVQPL